MEAVHARWPKAIVQVCIYHEIWVLNDIDMYIIAKCTRFSQFEDFQMKWAFETLHRYRKKFCMFNDDIQVNKSYIFLCLHIFTLENIFWKF